MSHFPLKQIIPHVPVSTILAGLVCLFVLAPVGCAYHERLKFFSREAEVNPQITPLTIEKFSTSSLEPLPPGVHNAINRARRSVPTEPSTSSEKEDYRLPEPVSTHAPLSGTGSVALLRRVPPVESDSQNPSSETGSVAQVSWMSAVESDSQNPVSAETVQSSTAHDMSDGEPIEMTLEQARAAALEGNLDLEVASFDPEIAVESVLKEIGRFEATFDGTLKRNRNDPPPPWPGQDYSPWGYPSSYGGSATDTLLPGVQIPLTTGGTLALRQKTLRNSYPGSSLSSLNSLAPTLNLSHKLLRNAGFQVATSGIQLATLQRGRVDAATKLTAIRVLATTEQAYWVLFGAQNQLNILRQQVLLAEQQVVSAKRLVEAGVISNVDVLRSEAGLLARRQAVVDSELQLLLRIRELKRVVQIPGLEVDSRALIRPVSEPNLVGLILDRSALSDQALQNRLELVDLALQYEQDLVRIDVAQNQVLPELDFVFEGKLYGTALDYSSASQQAWEGEYHDWFAGLSMSLPLAGNRSARADLRAATLSRAKTVAQQRLFEVEIRKQMDDAVDRFEQSWRQILATEQSVAAALKTFQAEARLFQLGQRTSDLVLIAAGNLADSELRLIQAVVAFQLSRVDIALATGTMLGYGQIELVPPDELPAQNPVPIAPSP